MACQIRRDGRARCRRLRELEAKNIKLKMLPDEAHLNIHALNTAFGVKRWQATRLPHMGVNAAPRERGAVWRLKIQGLPRFCPA